MSHSLRASLWSHRGVWLENNSPSLQQIMPCQVPTKLAIATRSSGLELVRRGWEDKHSPLRGRGEPRSWGTR